MSTELETTRIVRSWLEDGITRLPDRVLDDVLGQLPATPQRRHFWSAWRPSQMNIYAKIAAAAAAVAVVAVVGYQLLPGRAPGPGGPSVAPSPTAAVLIARGTFGLLDGEIVLNATGSGDSVTGTMVVTHPDGNFRVDLRCTRTTEDGVILLAGDIIESESPHARQGVREILVLKPGSPIHASIDSEGRRGGDVRPADSCPALLQQVIDTGTQTIVDENGMIPIEGGSIEFGP